MIRRVPFYFLRHGATDPHIDDLHIPLNTWGCAQAADRAAFITELPIRTVCISPLRRAQETATIVAQDAFLKHTIDDLGECTHAVWHHMTRADTPDASTQAFLDRVARGVVKALKHPGPVLIVAHGGVHYALCRFLEIDGHSGIIDHCVPVHFMPTQDGKWRASKL